MKYLHSRIDRARFWRREGSVLVVNMVALRQEMETKAGQQRQKGTVVGYCSCRLRIPPMLLAVETAMPGGNAKGLTGGASQR